MSLMAIFFILIFIIGLLLTFNAPEYGAMTAIILYFINAPKQWWYSEVPDMRYMLILNIVLLVAFFSKYNDFKLHKFASVPHFKWFAMLMVCVLFSGFWAVESTTHNRQIENYIKICVFIFLFFKMISSQKSLDWAIACYCFGAFYASFRAWEIGRSFGLRLEEITLQDGTDANGVAAAILVSIPMLVFYIFWGKRKWLRILALIALAFTVNALVLFNSRGAFLGLIFSVAIMLFRTFREGHNIKIFIRILVACSLCFVVLFYMADVYFWERMGTIEEEKYGSEVTVSRIEYWMKSFEMLADHPLGLGAGGYESLSPKYMPEAWLTGGKRAVHSTWFEVLTSFGFQGIVLFLMYYWNCFKELKDVRLKLKASDDEDHNFRFYQSIALEACMAAYLVPATFIGTFFVECSYWIPMFIAVFYRINFYNEGVVADPCKV